MSRVLLSLGSNIDRERNLEAALNDLAARYRLLCCSSVYESEAVGFDGGNFYNFVAEIETQEPLEELAKSLRLMEENNGRIRSDKKFSSRTLDIDILTYDDYVGDFSGIVLPRDEILKYAFVLLPLNEIVPEQVCPGAGKNFAELWQSHDLSGQKLWPVAFQWQQRSLPFAA